MSAQIIPLTRAETGGEQPTLRPPPQPTIPAWLSRAARRYWRRTRLTVEGFGWLCAAASIIAAIKG